MLTGDFTYFACPYLETGVYKLRIFSHNLDGHTAQPLIRCSFNINEMLGIDDDNVPNFDVASPNTTCTFISDDLIFVNVYANRKLQHWHLVLNWKTSTVHSSEMIDMAFSSEKNYPSCTYLDSHFSQIHVFYRHGEAFAIDLDMESLEISPACNVERITDKAVADIHFFGHDVMIARSST